MARVWTSTGAAYAGCFIWFYQAQVIEAAFARFGSAHKQLIALTTPRTHRTTLAGDILSPNDTPRAGCHSGVSASLPAKLLSVVETAQRRVKGTGFVCGRSAAVARPWRQACARHCALKAKRFCFGQADIQRQPIRGGHIDWVAQHGLCHTETTGNPAVTRQILACTPSTRRIVPREKTPHLHVSSKPTDASRKTLLSYHTEFFRANFCVPFITGQIMATRKKHFIGANKN